MAEEWMEPSDDEIKMSFVASCIEDAADREGVSYRDMFERMEKVGLIENFIYKHYDTLHTESRRNVTTGVLEALHNWENHKKQNNSFSN